MSTTTTAANNNFKIKETPIENFRPLKVRVIGAGISGIYLGIRIPQRLRNVDLQIYEKNEGVGGTWWENRYPGCACDIPAHSYQYSFEPNPDWSGFYSPSDEIRQYLHGVAEKYGVFRFVKLRHKVVECTWDDNTKKWKLVVENIATGVTFEDDADFVVAARGNLNEFSWPDIAGLNEFKGELMHSATWNESYDFKNKKIGLIGGGSSSIQIVPKLQKVEGANLSVFVRNKTWISDPFGDVVMLKLGLDPNVLEFSEEQRKEFVANPEAYLQFRKTIEADGNAVHGLTCIRDSEKAAGYIEILRAMATQRLLKKPELLPSFTPKFGIGCRRLTPGVGYLEALVEENVDFIPDPISCINAEGIKLKNGKQIDIDVLVCATGFNVSTVPPFPVTGQKGVTLKEKFTPFPQTYLSVAVDGFPNYFMMLGPNAGIGAGSLTLILEGQGDYIIKCIRKLQKEDYVSMTPKQARVRDFSDYVGEYFKRTVYMDVCKSWYKSERGHGDRITALWPGSSLHMLETLRAPRWEDYEFENTDENRLRWLGTGWSVCLIEGEGDPSFYLNPDIVDIPPAETPESEPRYKIRSFSH